MLWYNKEQNLTSEPVKSPIFVRETNLLFFDQVMAVQTTFSRGRWDTVCTTATVERHLACQCACKQKREHCNPKIHIYDPASCSCQCLEQAGRVSCGAGKKWDTRTCSCTCPGTSWRPCSTGYTYDSHDSW